MWMLLLILCLFLLVVAYWQKIKNLEATLFPIKYIRVSGQFQNVDRDQIRKLLKPIVNAGFFSADLQAIQSAVVAITWVDTAEIRRVWPDIIAVKIYEQQAAARWQQQSLLNTRGEIFTPVNVELFTGLPAINSSSGQAHKLFEIMNKITQGLNTKNLALTQLQVTERQSWKVTLSNGIKLQLGRTQPMQKFWQFLKILPILGAGKIALIKTIDMRYPNGFSILWNTKVALK